MSDINDLERRVVALEAAVHTGAGPRTALNRIAESCGDDARKWAELFCQINSNIDISPHLLEGWFANAIEHSYEIRTKEIDK